MGKGRGPGAGAVLCAGLEDAAGERPAGRARRPPSRSRSRSWSQAERVGGGSGDSGLAGSPWQRGPHLTAPAPALGSEEEDSGSDGFQGARTRPAGVSRQSRGDSPGGAMTFQGWGWRREDPSQGLAWVPDAEGERGAAVLCKTPGEPARGSRGLEQPRVGGDADRAPIPAGCGPDRGVAGEPVPSPNWRPNWRPDAAESPFVCWSHPPPGCDGHGKQNCHRLGNIRWFLSWKKGSYHVADWKCDVVCGPASPVSLVLAASSAF